MVSFAILRQCTFRIAILIYFVAMVSFFNIAMVSFCQIAMVSFNLLRTSVFRILLPGISRIATVIHFCCKMSYCEIELFLLRKCIFLLQEKMNAIIHYVPTGGKGCLVSSLLQTKWTQFR